MFTYPVYKEVKEVLKHIAPPFNYTGQYQPSKGNITYLVPAIYIELPKETPVTHWGRGIKVMLPARVKIHYISNAPFNQHDNFVQDAALEAHAATVKIIDDILQRKTIKKPNGDLLTQQWHQVGANENNVVNGHIVTVLQYETEIYAPNLAAVKPGTNNADINFNL